MQNIHAGCISYKNKGILILGDSGTGKSDLALRMIMDKGAELVSDDRTDIENIDGRLFASAPQNLAGLMEVRGVGILNFPFKKKTQINLLVQLVKNPQEIERLPEKENSTLENVILPQIKLYAFESSVLNKLILALGVS